MAQHRRSFMMAGVEFTRDGEDIEKLKHSASIFEANWDGVHGLKSSLTKPEDARQDVWDEMEETLFANEIRIKQLQSLETWLKKKGRPSLLICDEQDVREFLEQWQGKALSTINNETGRLRSSFKLIGRAYRWAGGTMITNTWSKPWLHTGNPVTETIQKDIRKKAAPPTGPKNERKEGVPVSVVLLFWTIIMLVVKAVKVFKAFGKRLKQQSRITNLCFHLLLKAILMHEPGRPGDVSRNIRHTDITLLLHESVYALTLVFLSTDTLVHLMQKGLLDKYKIALYKGKCIGKFRTRVKPVIPTEQNSLDLIWYYAVMMRMILMVDPECLKDHGSRRKQGQFWISGGWMVFDPNYKPSGYTKDAHQKLGLHDFTFYSIRYGQAEEAKELGIDRRWTQWVMGHKNGSNTQDDYAANGRVRASVDDKTKKKKKLPLGTDRYYLSDDPNAEFELQVNAAFDRQWLKKAFKEHPEMCTEFEQTAALVKRMLEMDDKRAREILLEKLPKSDDWIKQIPFGMHIQLSEGLLSDKLKDEYEAAKLTLQRIFTTPPCPPTIPQLCFFAQTVYGKWRKSSHVVVKRKDDVKSDEEDSDEDDVDDGADEDDGDGDGDEVDCDDEEEDSEDDDEEDFEVEKVLDHRTNPDTGMREYYVHWKGYTSDDDTWEPRDGNEHDPDAGVGHLAVVHEYEADLAELSVQFDIHDHKYVHRKLPLQYQSMAEAKQFLEEQKARSDDSWDNLCFKCSEDGGTERVLCCEAPMCRTAVHKGCAGLDEEPDHWFCGNCSKPPPKQNKRQRRT